MNHDGRAGTGQSRRCCDLDFRKSEARLDGSVMEENGPYPEAVPFSNPPEQLAPSATDREKAERTDACFNCPGGIAEEQRRKANAELLHRLRNPTLTLPSFVDSAYIAKTTHFVNSDLRRIHGQRQFVRNVTGYPWPEDRPAPEDMPRILLEALRYPAFVIAFQSQFFAPENKSYRSFIKRQI